MNYNLIQAALGQIKGDLLLKNGIVADVFNGRWIENDVLLKDGRIAAIGQYQDDAADEVIDCHGDYLIPGLIDPHIHIESSHMSPAAFGHAMLTRGVTTVVADPHEIANAAGVPGLEFMLESAEQAPMDIFYMVPSSVPSTNKETAGAEINSTTIKELLEKYPDKFLGLGELMNVPGILYGDTETLDKINNADGTYLDGHYPLGTGKELGAYASAGITSDHESVTPKEVTEKLMNGISVFLRQGSSARNLKDIISAVNDHNHSRCSFCSDDINASDIVKGGSISRCILTATKEGQDLLRSIEMATINPANHYGLHDRGAIAPGYIGDILRIHIPMDNYEFTSEKHPELYGIWKNGKTYEPQTYQGNNISFGTFTLKNKDIAFPAPNGKQNARVIQAYPGQIVTHEQIIPIKELAGHSVSRLYVIERYGKNGNIGYALIDGFNLKEGAIASSVAHDSHNLIILASSDREAKFIAEEMEKQGGGMMVCHNKKVLASMALPIGGLMCDEDVAEVARKEESLKEAACQLGITMENAFMTLAFMALPVISKLKLTDQGLFDADKFDFVDLYL